MRIASFMRGPRSSNDCPRRSNSSLSHPAPTPRIIRPPVRKSRVATALATISGGRSGRIRTEVPSRTLRATAPTQVNAVNASRYGMVGGQGGFRSGRYGYGLADCSGRAI